MLLKSPVIIDAMEPMTKADKVLKIFAKESKKIALAANKSKINPSYQNKRRLD
jgi:hypothetical protein